MSEARAEAEAAMAVAVSEARAEAEAAMAIAVSEARAEAATLRGEVERLQGEVGRAQDGLAQAQTQLGQAQVQLEQVRAEVTHARDEVEHARGDLQAAQAETLTARGEADQARQSVDRVRADAAQAVAAAMSTQTDVHEPQGAASVGRLLAAVRSLDTAGALTEVFDGLTDMAAREADRVALLLVRGSQLRVWRFAGFDCAPDPRTVGIKLDGTGIIAEAVRTKQPKAAGPESSAFGFAPLPTGRSGVVAPIEVGGQVVAVLYADNATRTSETTGDVWQAEVEILARHAARCLETLTIQHAASLAAKPAHAGRPQAVAAG